MKNRIVRKADCRFSLILLLPLFLASAATRLGPVPRSNSRAEPRLCACWRIAGYSKSTRPVHSKPFTNSSSLTGARRAGLHSFTHYHDGKSGYLSQSSLPLYFGLGTAEGIDRVEVLWPSGSRQEVTKDLLLNGLLTIKEVEAAKGKAKSE